MYMSACKHDLPSAACEGSRVFKTQKIGFSYIEGFHFFSLKDFFSLSCL